MSFSNLLLGCQDGAFGASLRTAGAGSTYSTREKERKTKGEGRAKGGEGPVGKLPKRRSKEAENGNIPRGDKTGETVSEVKKLGWMAQWRGCGR